MADSPKFTISEPSILISPPNDFVPEKEKDREWFLRYTRWVVANFYNAPAPNLTPNQTGTPIVGFAQQAMVSWSYALQKQHNYQQYYTTDFSGAELPVPFIPGGEIKQIVKHMGGVLLGAIENIEITATNLSEGVASKRAELYEKAMLKYEVGQIAEQILPPGVTFDPINDPDADLSSKEDIEKFVTSWQDEYSIIAEKIGDSQMWADELKKKFLKDGVNQYVSGLSCIHTTVESGYVCNHVVPDYETIFDNRDDDPFKENSLVCGQVKHNMPYQEVVRKYEKWLSKEEIIEIRHLAIAGYANVNEFTGFYNVGLGCGNQFYWWSGVGTSSMTVSVATVYFIAPRDWRYRNYRRTGETVKIEDDQMYSVKMQDVPGADIPGDYSGWDVHQATLIGNKYLVNFGYMPNTLRKRNKKGRPLLPMRILMADTALGQNTSMVQSLIPLQNDLDMLEWKIKEKVANDFGRNYIFNGNKFDGEPAIDIINNLKRMHVHVAAGSSGEPDDPQNAQRMVEPVDMTLDANIIRYVELSQYKNDKMNAYASVSEISLGQQPGTVGKGVQEKTILQNSKGIATINWSIMKHFQDVVQYNVNMKN